MSKLQSMCRRFQVNAHIFENMTTLWNICHFFSLLSNVYTLVLTYARTGNEETLQIRPPVTKKYRGRNKTRWINNRFVTCLIVCSRCQKDGHNHHTCNAISYFQFRQVKDIILQYSTCHFSFSFSFVVRIDCQITCDEKSPPH